MGKCPHLVDLVGSKTSQSPYVVLANLYTRRWLSHHCANYHVLFVFLRGGHSKMKLPIPVVQINGDVGRLF